MHHGKAEEARVAGLDGIVPGLRENEQRFRETLPGLRGMQSVCIGFCPVRIPELIQQRVLLPGLYWSPPLPCMRSG